MKKVVKVEIIDTFDGCFWRTICDGVRMASQTDYKLYSSAIRKARQFFKKLGYEVEIVK